MAWASPVTLDEDKNAARTATTLIQSSSGSWLSSSNDIMPKVGDNGQIVYRPEGEPSRHTLGVMIEGEFSSYFADKDSPLLQNADGNALDAAIDTANGVTPPQPEQPPVYSAVIKHSSSASRLILFSSNDFLRDTVVQMSGGGTNALSAFQLTANAIDYSLEDTSLTQIRSRGHFNRTLIPMERSTRWFWEYLNYALAAIAIAVVALIYRRMSYARRERYRSLVSL